MKVKVLNPDVVKAIMKLFRLENGYLLASRSDESGEWKVVHRTRDKRKTLGNLKDIVRQLDE